MPESHNPRDEVPYDNLQLESRMREIRPSGSEGGGASSRSPYPYQQA